MSSIGSSSETSLVATTGRAREAYRVQELLRTHLLADLQRQGPRRVAELHAVAARWWADQDEPVRALEHAAAGRDRALLIELLHRFAIPLILAGHHGPLRRALARVGASSHRDRSLAGPVLRAGPFRGRGTARGAGRPAPRTTGLAGGRDSGRDGGPRQCCAPSPSSSAPTSAVTGPPTRPRS